jgi:hypothetical protein
MPTRYSGEAGIVPQQDIGIGRKMSGQYADRAVQARGMIHPNSKQETSAPEKTAGGALGAAAGGAAAGVSIAPAGGWWSAAIGAIGGLAMYLGD